MVKAVIGDEIILKSFEDRVSLSNLSSEVGLVIGKLSPTLNRGFVYNLTPTPFNDAHEPASSILGTVRDDKKKSSKGKSQVDSSLLIIDRDWVAEHARQVSRMLVGGIKVIGIYIWASDSSFKNSALTLCQTLMGVADVTRILDIDLGEKLMIHISYSSRRWTCRSCIPVVKISSSSLLPCDFKIERVVNSFQTFRCMYNFDLRLPIFHDISHVKTLNDTLRDGISIHAMELSGSKAIIDGNLVIKDEPCISDAVHEVELLLPLTSDILVQVCSKKEVSGIVVFSGSLCSYACLNSKEPVSQALSDIKEDIIMSLQTRLDIICDEADGDMNVTIEIATEKHIPQLVLQTLRKQCSLSFPRRIFVPWLAGALICDYLQPSETLEVLQDHCVELLSIEVPQDLSRILQPETEPQNLYVESFWDVAVPKGIHANSEFDFKKNSSNNASEKVNSSIKFAHFNAMVALLILLLSMLVASVMFFMQSS